MKAPSLPNEPPRGRRTTPAEDRLAPYDDVSDLLETAVERRQLQDSVSRARFFRLRWVRFKIIDGCNIRCVMCNHWRREGYRKQALSFQRLLSLADELAALEVQYVRWSGGEPTLRRDLPEVIRKFSDLGIASGITTNGTLLDPDYASRLRAAGVQSIHLSLESAEPSIHDRVVGADGAFRKLLGGLRALMSAPPPLPTLVIQTVLTRLNIGPGLAGLLDIAADHGVRLIRFQPVVVSHLRDEEQSLLPTPLQIQSFRDELLPAMQSEGAKRGIGIEMEGSDLEPPASQLIHPSRLSAPRISSTGKHAQGYYAQHLCYLPYYHCTIDHRGNVYPCCHMRDASGVLGNVIERPLHEVLQSAAAQHLRERLRGSTVPAACQTCTMQITENQLVERLLAADCSGATKEG